MDKCRHEKCVALKSVKRRTVGGNTECNAFSEVAMPFTQWRLWNCCPADNVEFVRIANEIDSLKTADCKHGIVAIESSRIENRTVVLNGGIVDQEQIPKNAMHNPASFIGYLPPGSRGVTKKYGRFPFVDARETMHRSAIANAATCAVVRDDGNSGVARASFGMRLHIGEGFKEQTLSRLEALPTTVWPPPRQERLR